MSVLQRDKSFKGLDKNQKIKLVHCNKILQYIGILKCFLLTNYFKHLSFHYISLFIFIMLVKAKKYNNGLTKSKKN